MSKTSALYSVDQIRAIEKRAMAALPAGALMQRAGHAAAELALDLIPAPYAGSEVLILAGPGNNGGDALEVATHLSRHGLEVSVLYYADPSRQPPDARQALLRAQNSRVRFLDTSQTDGIAGCFWALVVDGLFGIGLTRPITGMQRNVIEIVNQLNCPVLALDIPSGLGADSGAIAGGGDCAVRATHTITFIANKPGFYTANGRDFAGQVQVAGLDIDDQFFPAPYAQINEAELFAHALRPRMHNSHKGSYGDIAIIGGAQGMAGAAVLAARTAAKCGAGRVYAGFVDHAPAYDSLQPELMFRVATALDFSSSTVVIGPGLGASTTAHQLVEQALDVPGALVIDADALNMIAAEPELQARLMRRTAESVLTPHPLEAARLLGMSSAEVQSDRIAAACELSRRFNATVVLKGSGTVVTQPGGAIVINTTGNPGLATAGTGDVLAGLCGALIAQRWSAWQASLGAVWLHGTAADLLVEQGTGPVGLTAGELIPGIRTTLNQLLHDHGSARAATK